MGYQALYRRYRPARFEDFVGQEAVIKTLRSQIMSGRIAHAYLFCGTRGTGKTTVAKILAKAVNCEHPVNGSPCNECAMCKAIQAGTAMNVFEIDAASNNGVDNIREIREEVSYRPTEGKYKVYIIDEVHMLSIGAFNALLKTLEEPPAYVIFILATTEVHKIPITILSRCQRYDFRRISIDTMKELTQKEQVQIEEKAVRYIAKVADGSMRDALSLLDQCIAFYFEQELTYDKVLDVLGAVDTGVFSRMLREILKGDAAAALGVLQDIVLQGRELSQFVTDFAWYLRNLLLIKSADGVEDIIDVSSDNLVRLKEEAELAENDTIMRYIRILSELSGQIRYATQKRILIEMAVIKLCRPAMETDTASLADRIRQVEEKLEKGIPMMAVNPGAGSGSVPGNGTAPLQGGEKPVGKAELPKAIPEDIQNVVSRWSRIVDETANPMKSYLKNAYPSLSGDGKLLVVVQDGLPSDYFKRQENRDQLKAVIGSVTGKDMEIIIQSAENGRNPEDLYPDLTRLVDQTIDMEIEELDEIPGNFE